MKTRFIVGGAAMTAAILFALEFLGGAAALCVMALPFVIYKFVE